MGEWTFIYPPVLSSHQLLLLYPPFQALRSGVMVSYRCSVSGAHCCSSGVKKTLVCFRLPWSSWSKGFLGLFKNLQLIIKMKDAM